MLVIFSDKSAFKFHFHFIKNVIFRINIRNYYIWQLLFLTRVRKCYTCIFFFFFCSNNKIVKVKIHKIHYLEHFVNLNDFFDIISIFSPYMEVYKSFIYNFFQKIIHLDRLKSRSIKLRDSKYHFNKKSVSRRKRMPKRNNKNSGKCCSTMYTLQVERTIGMA